MELGIDIRIITPSVAQFRFNPYTSEWTLYCADRNSRWYTYTESDPAPKIEALLQAVDEDVTGIFQGKLFREAYKAVERAAEKRGRSTGKP